MSLNTVRKTPTENVPESVRNYERLFTREELDEQYRELLANHHWRATKGISARLDQKYFKELRDTNVGKVSMASLNLRQYLEVRLEPFKQSDRATGAVVSHGCNVFRDMAMPYYDALCTVPGVDQDVVMQEFWKLNKYIQALKALMKESNENQRSRLIVAILSYAPTLLNDMQDGEELSRKQIKDMLEGEFKGEVDFDTLITRHPELKSYIPSRLLPEGRVAAVVHALRGRFADVLKR